MPEKNQGQQRKKNEHIQQNRQALADKAKKIEQAEKMEEEAVESKQEENSELTDEEIDELFDPFSKKNIIIQAIYLIVILGGLIALLFFLFW